MKRSLLLLSACLSMATVWGQSWSYLANGSPTSQANDLIIDGDENLISCGSDNMGIFGAEGPVRVVKQDNAGTVLWETTIESPGIAIGEVSATMIAECDGGYILFCGGMNKPLVVKIDDDGNVLWNSADWCAGLAGGSIMDAFGYVSGDTVALVGFNSGFFGGGLHIYTMSLADGSFGHDYDFGMDIDGDALISVNEIAVNGESEMVVVGGVSTADGLTPFAWKFDISSGAPVDAGVHAVYTDYPEMEALGICRNNAGGYAVSISGPFGGNSVVIQTDDDCAISWAHTFAPTIPTDIMYLYDVAVLYDGTYAVAATNLDNVMLYNGTPEIILLDAAGLETDRIPVAGGLNNYVNSIIATWDYNFAFCGYINADEYLAGSFDTYYMVQKSGAGFTLPECIYNCVWPGDASNDGIVNMDDLLNIGVAYGTAGTARLSADIDWYAHFADAWTDVLPDGTNAKYVDCNGDATINDDDTLAITNNYGMEHALVLIPMREEEGDIPLYLQDPGVLTLGYHEIPIMLGDAINTVDAIYGIRFSITFDSTMIDKSSVRVRFDETWMGTADISLEMSKDIPEAQHVDAGYVRTNHANVGGDGQIGTLEIVVVDNIAGKTEGDPITLNITNARGIKLDMTELSIVTQPLIVETGVEEIQNNIADIYPNPSSEDLFHIRIPVNTSLQTVYITDLSGRVMKQYSESEIASDSYPTGNIASGTYLVHLILADGTEEAQPLVILH